MSIRLVLAPEDLEKILDPSKRTPEEIEAARALMREVREFGKTLVIHPALNYQKAQEAAGEKLTRWQSAGYITSYSWGEINGSAVHVHIFMPPDKWRLENRQHIQRKLRTLGQPHGVYIDSHILPDSEEEASQP